MTTLYLERIKLRNALSISFYLNAIINCEENSLFMGQISRIMKSCIRTTEWRFVFTVTLSSKIKV